MVSALQFPLAATAAVGAGSFAIQRASTSAGTGASVAAIWRVSAPRRTV